MLIKSFSVKNYRSIGTVTRANLGQYTVFVGPNNQGKTNLIKAMGIGMELINRWARVSGRFAPRNASRANSQRDNLEFLPRYAVSALWNWEEDYPLFKRNNSRLPPTEIEFEFSLSDSECVEFFEKTTLKCNGTLLVKLILSREGVAIKFLKQGPGSQTYKKNSAKIAGFISEKVELVTMPAIRTAEASGPIFNSLINEKIRELENDEEYQSVIHRIAELRGLAISSVNSDIRDSINRYIPSVDEVNIFPEEIRNDISLREVKIKNGSYETSLDNQGEGIKSLVTLSMIHYKSMIQASDQDKSHILIIDEPESHLHPNSIHELKKLLSEISQNEQVIIATHNPIFVNRESVSNNLIVENNKAKPAIRIAEVRDSLGVQVQDNLSSAEIIVLVEGVTDQLIVKKALASFDTTGKIKNMLDDGLLVIKSTAGVSKMVKHIQNEKSTLCKVYVVCDDDAAGRKKMHDIVNSGVLDPKYIYIIQHTADGYRETEIEDFISPDLYISALSHEFGRVFDSGHFANRSKKWSKNFEVACRGLGILDDPENESKAKQIIAKVVETSDNSDCIDELRNSMEQLVANIVGE